jgi:hypothetical protein
MVGIEGIVVGMVGYGVIGRGGSVGNVGNMVVGSVGRDGSVGNSGNVTLGRVGIVGSADAGGGAGGVSKNKRDPRHMLLLESDTVMIIERRKQYLEKAMVFK